MFYLSPLTSTLISSSGSWLPIPTHFHSHLIVRLLASRSHSTPQWMLEWDRSHPIYKLSCTHKPSHTCKLSCTCKLSYACKLTCTAPLHTDSLTRRFSHMHTLSCTSWLYIQASQPKICTSHLSKHVQID